MKINQEIQDLVQIAEFNAMEKNKFLAMVRKELAKKRISLDCFLP